MRYTSRRRKVAKKEGASFWTSYSDLMSALLLVFMLIMFYSVYQYMDMLEIKTAEILKQSGLLEEKEKSLTESQAKLTESEQALLAQQAKLVLFDSELKDAQALLESQKQQLEEAQALLAGQQTQLEEQKTQMAGQQAKLDALVGVRSQIITALSNALSSANIKASVDSQSGAIRLESGVLFDVGQSVLKPSGMSFLDTFIPVYMNVLLSPENQQYVSEIIVEGHTDTTGDYMTNLTLSQNRAAAVLEYILADGYSKISSEQKNQLRAIITANGRSKSNPILDANGQVDMAASRRVEFKFRLKDEEMISEMRRLLGELE